MEALVLKHAQEVLATPMGWAANDTGYLGRWEREYSRFAETNEKKWLYTSYGYAIEQLTTDDLASTENLLPAGHVVRSQVAHGHTRPDFVVLDDQDVEVAWIDVTSDSPSSSGHITRKQSSSWKSKPYVFEVRYPPLDVLKLGSATLSEGAIALRKKKAKAAKQAGERNIRALAKQVVGWLANARERTNRAAKKRQIKDDLQEEALLRGQGLTDIKYSQVKGLLVMLADEGIVVGNGRSPLYTYFGFTSRDGFSKKEARELFFTMFD